MCIELVHVRFPASGRSLLFSRKPAGGGDWCLGPAHTDRKQIGGYEAERDFGSALQFGPVGICRLNGGWHTFPDFFYFFYWRACVSRVV